MDEKILQKLKEHHHYVCKKYGEDNVIGTFLFGSQNYGIDTEDSDVDTLSLLVPKLRELAFEKEISKEHMLSDGDHILVKDIRLYIDMLVKQNINFTEILFTDYYILNKKYRNEWQTGFKLLRDKIVKIDPVKAVFSIKHQAIHTLKQSNNFTDGKKIANVERMIYFLKHYTLGASYEVCIKPVEAMREHLIALKKGEPETKYTYDDLMKKLDAFSHEGLDKMACNPIVIKYMEEAILKMLVKNLI